MVLTILFKVSTCFLGSSLNRDEKMTVFRNFF